MGVGSGVPVGDGMFVGVSVGGMSVWVGMGEAITVAGSGAGLEQLATKTNTERSAGMYRDIINSTGSV